MPGLFEQFPHTNLHELNLDWIIDLLNQFKEDLENSAVLSVNGQTGHVTLYESENVILPALPEGVDQWRLVRMMNGQNIGILFYDGNVYLQRGNTNLRLLTRDDIPADAGVLSWNGQTGIVIATGENIIRSEDNPVSIDQAITDETTERTNQDNTFRNQINIINNYLADTPQYANQMKMSMSDATTVENTINTIKEQIAFSRGTYTPSITAGTGFEVDNISFRYNKLANLLQVCGRFNIINNGTDDTVIRISLPDGMTAYGNGAGSCGSVNLSRAFSSTSLSIKILNDSNQVVLQAGAGGNSSNIIGTGYVLVDFIVFLK